MSYVQLRLKPTGVPGKLHFIQLKQDIYLTVLCVYVFTATRTGALAPPPSYKELGPSVAGPAAGIVGAGLSGAFPSPRSGPARRQADLEAARVPVISNKYALGDDSVIVSSPGAPDFRSQARRK